MKRISTSALSIFAVLGVLAAAAAACSSGDAEPGTTPGGSGGGGGTKAGSGGSAGSGAGSGGASATGGTGGSGGSAGGAGGAGGSAGSGAKSVCDTKTRQLPIGEAVIDNFETATRFKGWYSFADTTPAHTPIAIGDGGALNTGKAAHVAATGIKAPTAGGFGAGFGFNMVDETGQCAGISAFDGVSFWAKGTAGADNVLTFQAVHPAQQPTTEMPAGDCMLPNCFNHPKKAITITADWAQYTVKWSELTGPVSVTSFIFGINLITPGPAYDVWIDEVTLFKGTAPTGPVGGGDGGP